jgi:Tfp pilus assembly protein PilP
MRPAALLLLAAFPLAVAAAADGPEYDPHGRRDPFQAPLVERATPVPTSALERYDLAELRLEGIISGIADSRATVTVPGGESFLVRTGTPIGRGGGRVSRITSAEVIVREETRNLDGLLLVRESALSLAR